MRAPEDQEPGAGVGFEERRDLSHVLGIVVRPADVPDVRAGQGPGFARLARLGAALLEVLLVRHEASTGSRPPGPPDVARLLPLLDADTDADAGPDPVDLLHVAVAAGHRSASWSGVRAVVSRLLSEQAGPVPRLPGALSTEQAVAGGRAVAAAAGLLLRLARDPADDLSTDLADDLASDRPSSRGQLPEDRLADVGRVLVVKGEQAAVERVLPLLR